MNEKRGIIHPQALVRVSIERGIIHLSIHPSIEGRCGKFSRYKEGGKSLRELFFVVVVAVVDVLVGVLVVAIAPPSLAVQRAHHTSTRAAKQRKRHNSNNNRKPTSKHDLSDLPSCEQEKQELVVVFVQFVLFLKIYKKKNSYYLQRPCVFLLMHSINPFLPSFPSLSLSRSLACSFSIPSSCKLANLLCTHFLLVCKPVE
jgi:hypothetical protein